MSVKYKLFVFVPNKESDITKVIEAASKAGAGVIGNYSQCAFITEGFGTWKAEKGSNPTIGKVGEVSKVPEVKIEMECPVKAAKRVKKEIQKAHPYEEVEIDFVELKKV